MYWRTSIIQSQHNLVVEWITVVMVASLRSVYTFMYQAFYFLVLVEFSSCEYFINSITFNYHRTTWLSVDRHRGSGGRYTLPHQHHVTMLQDGACCTFLEESLLSDSSQKKHMVMFDCNHTEVSQYWVCACACNVCVSECVCVCVCLWEPLIGLNFTGQQKIRLENSSSGLYRLCFVVPSPLFAHFQCCVNSYPPPPSPPLSTLLSLFSLLPHGRIFFFILPLQTKSPDCSEAGEAQRRELDTLVPHQTR